MKKIVFLSLVVTAFAAFGVYAQPRPVDNTAAAQANPPREAPARFEAKYEGGMFGFNKKEEGILKFDDDNKRLIFFDKLGKEKFAIPYKSMLIVSPQSQSVQSTAGKVVSVVPYAGIIGGFIKEKRRYLVIQFDDPDVEARGVVNFRIDDRDLLDSVIYALGKRGELKQRGDAWFRPKTVRDDDQSKSSVETKY